MKDCWGYYAIGAGVGIFGSVLTRLLLDIYGRRQ